MSRKNLLINEWDKIAQERYSDLKVGNDISFETILKPSFDAFLLNCDLENVLDVGCGVGVYTNHIAKISGKMTGIDMSATSIFYAEKDKCDNTSYYSVAFEDYAPQIKFSTIISNMTLMDMENLEELFPKFFDLLDVNGHFVFTITHPVFWPIYWNYDQISNFDYKNEIEIKEEFKTRNKTYTGLITTHFNRSLEFYIKGLIKAGFYIEDFEELSDPNRLIPKYPRFIIIKCVKCKESKVTELSVE